MATRLNFQLSTAVKPYGWTYYLARGIRLQQLSQIIFDNNFTAFATSSGLPRLITGQTLTLLL